MDLKRIREIVRLIKKEEIAEIELEDDEGYIHISTQPAGVPVSYQMPSAGPAAASNIVNEEKSPATQPDTSSGKFITSPMVGTFYAAPTPDAEPYVRIGESVKSGQTVCIIEAMKVMNEIKSDISGVVKNILVENGQPIEFGQELFEIV